MFLWQKYLIIIFSFIVTIELMKINGQIPCDLSYCNYEGECIQNNTNYECKCIGGTSVFFHGNTCSEKFDHCLSSPCENGAKCVSLVGQFLCSDCPKGFGGLWCKTGITNVCTNVVLQFNHIGYYGKEHHFLITIESLGQSDFALELVAQNYAIDGWETFFDDVNGIKRKWRRSNDLHEVTKTTGIRYANQLSYTQGYYHISKQIFRSEGIINLTLTIYDSATGDRLYFYHNYKILIINLDMKCIPKVKFLHGYDPLLPLRVDIAFFNNFEPVMTERCHNNSVITYTWKIYNSIGSVELKNIGTTKRPLLKMPPYSLWFKYYDEVISSYRIELEINEYKKHFHSTSYARCFIYVLPKPVKAVINGGTEREIGFKQSFYMDGGNSRDFALSPYVKQDLIYHWTCSSLYDTTGTACKELMGTTRLIYIRSQTLRLNHEYNITLTIYSKINLFSTDTVYQLIRIMETPRLLINVICVHNCAKHQFTKDDIIHLMAKCENCKLASSRNYQWSLSNNKLNVIEDLGKNQRMVYNPSKTITNADVLVFKVYVQSDGFEGIGSIQLRLNLPPTGGHCQINPKSGIVFETLFNVTCVGYMDDDKPLDYQFIADNFPIDRTNEEKTFIRLPMLKNLLVVICDQFHSCVVNKLTVILKNPPLLDNIDKFMKNNKNLITDCFNYGDTTNGLVLAKILSTYIKTQENVDNLLKEIENFEMKTLLNVEQMFAITQTITESLKPLNNEKANTLSKYFNKITNGLRSIIDDSEFHDLEESSFYKASEEISSMLSEFAVIWEAHPSIQIIATNSVSIENSLKESYTNILNFDVNILNHINNWLKSAIELNNCLQLLGIIAVIIHRPSERSLQIERNDFKLETYAFDTGTQVEINLNKDFVVIHVGNTTLKEIQYMLGGNTIVLQIVLMTNNPFWWYPDNQGLASDIFYFSAFGQNSITRSEINLTQPFEFELKQKTKNTQYNQQIVNGHLQRDLHMPIFSIYTPAKAVLHITFIYTTIALKTKLKIKSVPRSFEVRTSLNIVQSNIANHHKIFIINNYTYGEFIHLAVLADEPLGENGNNFSFITNVQQCLRWDFQLYDPEWSSDGCRPLEDNGIDTLKCECYHLSTFSSRSFSPITFEKLGDNILLKYIPLNWRQLKFNVIMLTLYILILAHASYYKFMYAGLLITNVETIIRDIDVIILTGDKLNACTTANITIKLQSIQKNYIVIIYQNPDRPQLQQTSMTKFYIAENKFRFPSKISLSIEQVGRYPSWYCRKIIIRHLINNKISIYPIFHWIWKEEITVEANTRNTSDIHNNNWTERYKNNISGIYINWFQFQTFLGPCLFEDFDILERTCIWICQMIFSMVFLTCHFGPTTMKSYEEERERYYTLNINIAENFLLSFFCYLISSTIYTVLAVILYNIKLKKF